MPRMKNATEPSKSSPHKKVSLPHPTRLASPSHAEQSVTPRQGMFSSVIYVRTVHLYTYMTQTYEHLYFTVMFVM